MPKTKISEYSQTAANNTDINSINLAEGMLPSDVNNAIRELMKQLKDFQVGAGSDPVTVGGNLVVSGTSNLIGTTVIDGITYPTADGTNGQVIQTNGSGALSFISPTSFVASPLSVTGNSSAGAEIRLPEDTDNGTNYVALKAPDTLASNLTLTLPSADGTSGQVLETNGSGVLSFGSKTSLATPLAVVGDATAGAEIRLPEDTDNGSNYVALKAPDTLASNVTFTLPSADGTNGQIIQTNGSGVLSFTTASAGDVTTTGTQTLTNKTISYANNTLTGVVGETATQTLTNKTLTDPAIVGTILEDVFTISDGAAFEIDPGNGSVQLITLGASRTPKATNFAAGESVILMVDDGTAYALTWTDATWGGSGVVWKTNAGSAPTLNTTGYTVITLWKVGTQVYGARVGDA